VKRVRLRRATLVALGATDMLALSTLQARPASNRPRGLAEGVLVVERKAEAESESRRGT
jgi:hypothetical protein